VELDKDYGRAWLRENGTLLLLRHLRGSHETIDSLLMLLGGGATIIPAKEIDKDQSGGSSTDPLAK
jgi:hypothetical protein